MELFPVHKRWVRKIYFCRFIYWDLDLKGSECALSMEYVFCSKSEIIAVTITRISKNSVPQRSRYRHRCTVAGLRGPKTGNAHSGKTERWLNEQIGQIEAHRNPMDSSVAILWKLEEGPEMVGVLPHAPLVRKRAETTIWDMFHFHPPAHCALVNCCFICLQISGGNGTEVASKLILSPCSQVDRIFWESFRGFASHCGIPKV